MEIKHKLVPLSLFVEIAIICIILLLYFQCPYCTKGFVNQTFMQAHLMRRHSEQISQLAASNQQSSQQGTTQPAPSGTTETQSSVNESVERELEEMRERLRLTESQLTEERNLRNTTLKRVRKQCV